MAEGLPTPKSREQLVSEMLQEYVGLTGINDLNTGSVITQFFDVVARAIARTSGDIFQILRDFSVDRARGEALNRIGDEERVYRNVAKVATGTVEVTDTSFSKIETKVYSGAPAPNIGSTTIKVSDAASFTATGQLYIGRGTPNIEGPISYSAVNQVGAFWEITLSSPTTKFHNISESIILGQGGTRNIPVNTTVTSVGTGATADINYTVSSAALLLDGENVNSNVQIVAEKPGSVSNAPIGGINSFGTEPFTNATVTNRSPLTTGADEELDDDYRDRIKKERLSRGLGTALAVKNAVLGIQAPDENARVTSNEIDTTNPEHTILYVDNGEGYEEKSEGAGLEFIVDSAIGGEQNFQLSTGGKQTSIAKAFLESTEVTPFAISGLDKLAVLVGGIISEHIFAAADFRANGSATAYEVVASINNNSDLTYKATTSGDGTKVVIRAKAEDDEYLQLTSPSSGTDAGVQLAFDKNEIATVLLYKNNELLNKNGRSAFLITKPQFNWNNSITNNDTLKLSVDGTDAITYTFINEDFIEEGQHSTVASQNSLSSWINVINAKVTGITAEVNGEQIKITSNLGPSSRAGIIIDPTSTLVVKGMFSADIGLSATGDEADFLLSRNTSQIKINTPLSAGDSLNLGSEFTRAELKSNPILGGQTTLSDTSYVWLGVDDADAASVKIGVVGETFLSVSKPGSGVIRYESTAVDAFGNAQVGDYVIIWSKELSATNRIEGRIRALTANTIDIKVTVAEETAAVVEGPILFVEGFTIIRSKYIPQKIKVDAGVYNINDIATVMNDQLDNAVVTIDNDETFIIRTNTESTEGALFLVDFNDPAKSLNFIKSKQAQSINTQIAAHASGFSDRQFPAFVHGKITTEVSADAPNAYINSIISNEDLAALGFDPSGFLCLSQSYGGIDDVSSVECVDIEQFSGTTITLEDSAFYRRSRVNDRYHVVNGYDFGHADTLVTILDNDPTGKTFNMPLYRTAVANVTLSSDTNNFRAYDLEGGNSAFTQFFADDFPFDNYKALMQAKNAIDPSGSVAEDAVLYRSIEWGRSGENFGIGYFYPTTANQGISHVVTVGEKTLINIFFKSGTAVTTTIDGTTEWNVTIVPAGGYDLVTYTHSGTGTVPGLGSVNAGDYVSLISTGDFSAENLGAYKVDSATASSFTTRRKTGEALVESDVASVDNNVIAFFLADSTTSQEIVDYATANLSDYIVASVLDDGGTGGAGVLSESTSENAAFAYDHVFLKDGKNYILVSDLDAGAGLPQFTFKNSLDLPTFSTNTADAYSFNDGENVKLVPITSLHVTSLLNVLAVTGFGTLGDIKSIERNTNLQLSTDILGSGGAVQIAGGVGTSATALIEGSASNIGSQDTGSSIMSIDASSAGGFHSDQWVKVSATETQKKASLISDLNSISFATNTPTLNFSKVELFGRTTGQRLFGRNRYHTRTRGRTFKVEKQGQFACISWDDVGTEPYFLKNDVNINDTASSTLTVYKDNILNTVDLTIDTGNARFDEANIGDILVLINRTNAANNGSYKIVGRSNDAKSLRIVNDDAVNELVSGIFTITDNIAVLTSSFTVGINVLVEGVDFIAGATINDTASNLAAAIALLPNITATSDSAIVTMISDVPNVTVLTSIAGGGATDGQAQLVAPTLSTNDLQINSEVSEGDSMIVGSDFNILNQGSFRVIRRFKNSVWVDNSNVVEEEVTLAAQLLTLGSDGSTDYDIVKSDGINRLKWNGAGATPVLENARPGDILTLGTDFISANQGSFHVIDSGENLAEISTFTNVAANLITTGQYFLVYSALDATPYYVWFNKDAGGGDPAPGGKTAIAIAITTGDTAEDIASNIENIVNTSFSADFTAVATGDDLAITNTAIGPTTNASNVDVGGTFSVKINQEGRRAYLDYINVNGATENAITIGDVLEIHREAVKFKEYEGSVPGDTITISDDTLGVTAGTYAITDILSETEVIISGTLVTLASALLDTNFNKIYVEEEEAYVGYKKISTIATNPDNLNSKSVVVDTQEQSQKINEIGGVSLSAMGKLTFATDTVRGVDSYKYHVGLIGEANRVVYGEPRDSTTYPGVSAAGAEIFIEAPLVRRIEVSIDVRIKTGVPFSTIVEEVRNAVASLINSNDIGTPIPISDIVSTVSAIVGIQAVAISSPQYDSSNDIIRVNSGEKALVLDSVSDILVSKID